MSESKQVLGIAQKTIISIAELDKINYKYAKEGFVIPEVKKKG